MAMIVQCRLNVISFKSMSLGSSADEMYSSIHQDGGMMMSENSPSFVQQQQQQVVDVGNHQAQPNDDQVSSTGCNFSYQCNKLKKKVPFQTRKR